MSDSRQQYFIQTIAIDGEEIERDLVIRSSYMESIGLRSPLLLIDIHDSNRKINDDKKISDKTVVTITAGDPNGDGVFFKEDFEVKDYPLVNDTIKIQAVSKGVAELLTPSTNPIYVNNDSAANIVAIFSKMPVESKSQERTMTIHVNNGEKPAFPLMQMARESGSAIWSAKGKIYIRKYKEFNDQAPAFKYEANNPEAEKTFSKVGHIKNDYMAKQASDYNYIGFNSTEGFQSAGNSSAPTRQVSSGDPQTLANLSIGFKPKLDVECEGNHDLAAGMVLEVIIYRYDDDSLIDESVPRKMVIGSVTHHEDRVAYRSRMILGVYE